MTNETIYINDANFKKKNVLQVLSWVIIKFNKNLSHGNSHGFKVHKVDSRSEKAIKNEHMSCIII